MKITATYLPRFSLMSNHLISNIYCLISILLFSTLSFSQTFSFPEYKVILVKLNTNQNQINILKQRGYYKDAQRIENQLKADGMAIQEAFVKFTRVPVYFFRSHDTDSLIHSTHKQDFIFRNDSIISDSQLIYHINHNLFIIGEFGRLSQEDLNISAFFLSNHQNIVFKRPLNYFVKRRYIFFKKPYSKIVSQLNELLSQKINF